MNTKRWKEFAMDLLIDVAGSMLIAIGFYNFAAASEFPVSGISGIAILFYHFFDLPIGTMTVLLNIPIILICYKLLGKKFLMKSFKTMIILSIATDVIAPMFPLYRGDVLLSGICMGAISGVGFALIYMRDTSTGGVDFIMLAIRAKKPHISFGKIIIVLDFSIVLLGGLILGGNVDKMICGMIATYIMSVVVDKAMYGMDAGKMTLIVTERGQEVADKIDELTGRGSTLLKGVGSYSKEEKQVVMCACNNKQMHMVQKAVKEVDHTSFMVIMESNEVRGEGFKPH